MGLSKNSIDARPSPVKKNIFVSGYSTIVMQWTWKNSFRILPSQKKYIFPFLTSETGDWGKIISLHLHRKNKKNVFYFQYYCGVQVLKNSIDSMPIENFQSALDPTKKIVSSYTTSRARYLETIVRYYVNV